MLEKLDLTDKLSLAFLDDVQTLLQVANSPKKTILHEEGEICNRLFFIQTGIARAFYFKDGKDITAHFAFESSSITAIDSFIQRKKSRYTIELLEDCEYAWMDYHEWYSLLDEKPEYEKFARLFLETIYMDIAERIEDLVFHTAKERYHKISSKFPTINQRVNLGHIASYIGITQETLSRIRGER